MTIAHGSNFTLGVLRVVGGSYLTLQSMEVGATPDVTGRRYVVYGNSYFRYTRSALSLPGSIEGQLYANGVFE